MNFQFYLEKLKNSETFKEFMKKNPSAFLCSCFFSRDFVEQDNRVHFEYYISSSKQMFSFQLEKDCEKVPIEINEGFTPEKISERINFDLGDVEDALFLKIRKEGIKDKVQKLFLSLQRKEGEDFLVGTVFISGMGIISFEMKVSTNEIISFKKKSFLDFFKILKK